MKSVEYKIIKTKTDFESIKIKSSKDAVEYARQFYHDDIGVYESFFIMFLNRGNRIIGHAKISQGGITGTVVDSKIIGKFVLDTLAHGIILVHNHPSGNLNISEQDRSITKKICQMMKIHDTFVVDHIILTEDGHTSFAESGELEY